MGGKISAATPHYVRCVKPNREKVPNSFISTMVYDQLLISGVIDCVQIRQQGFSSRFSYKEFVQRYHNIAALIFKQPTDTSKLAEKPDSKVDALHVGKAHLWALSNTV